MSPTHLKNITTNHPSPHSDLKWHHFKESQDYLIMLLWIQKEKWVAVGFLNLSHGLQSNFGIQSEEAEKQVNLLGKFTTDFCLSKALVEPLQSDQREGHLATISIKHGTHWPNRWPSETFGETLDEFGDKSIHVCSALLEAFGTARMVSSQIQRAKSESVDVCC